MMDNNLKVWKLLLERSEEDLSEAQRMLMRAKQEWSQIAEQREKLFRIRVEYLKQLSDGDGVSGSSDRLLLIRNFIVHLDQTISVVEKNLSDASETKASFKAKYDRQLRLCRKYEALRDRAISLQQKELETKENKERDLLNLSRFNANR